MISYGEFTAASGRKLPFKLECDTLTLDDLMAIAHLAVPRLQPFDECFGVPRGGLRLARLMQPWVSRKGKSLVVDDVWTTGQSMTRFAYNANLAEWRGFVIFARGPLPPHVTAMFHLDEVFR